MNKLNIILVGYSLLVTLVFAFKDSKKDKFYIEKLAEAFVRVGKAEKGVDDFKDVASKLSKVVKEQQQETVKVVKENIELKKETVEVKDKEV